ncbi:MAG: hypothetical protein Q9210_006103 [Variospora velana]
MPRHYANFIERVPGPSHTNNDAYRRDRYETYGTDTTTFPTQRARNAHPALVECTARGDRIRGDYQYDANSSRGYVARQDNIQRQYYEQTSGGYTPYDNRRLIDPAQDWLDSELEQGKVREEIYVSTPLAYGDLQSQKKHHGYIGDHYGYADEAENAVALHRRYAEDPASSARDLYGRSVPRGARPSGRGYPASIPDPGQYATDFQSVQTEPEYVIREPRKKKR